MKTEKVTVDGKDEFIILDYDQGFDDDTILDRDLTDTIEIALDSIQDEESSNGQV